MANQFTAGSGLFSDSESFLSDLSVEDESLIAGGTYYHPYPPKKGSSSDSGSGHKKKYGKGSS